MRIIYTIPRFFKLSIVAGLCLSLTGCATGYPKDFLKLSPDSLKYRQLQIRQYDTTEEKEIIAACAGVLQDLGFTLDDSETELGLVVASKDRTATDVGQVTLATIAVLLSGLSGSTSNAFERIDKVQKIRASVVTKPSLNSDKIVVRVTFQRIVWNARGDLSRLETLHDEKLYQGFFERLSKAVFLEAQKI